MELTHKPPYSRRQLRRFIKELDKELARSGDDHHTLIVGGGFVMSHQVYLRRTNDVDVISDGFTTPIAETARSVSMRLGIAADWINDAASGFSKIPVQQQPATLFQGTALTVVSPGLRFVLAMKLRAARDKDFNDCVALVQQLHINNEAEFQELLGQACIYPRNIMAEQQKFADQVFARSRKRRLIGRVLRRRRARSASRFVAESNSPPSSPVTPRIDPIDTGISSKRVRSNGRQCILRHGHNGSCRSRTGRR